MTLSGVVCTRAAAHRISFLLEQLRELCDEVVVLVDSLSVDGSEEVARGYTDRVFPFEHDDTFRSMRVGVFEHARGEWILWVDDDETLSPQWTRPLLDEIMSDRRVTHVQMPYRWIVPPGDVWITTGHWYPNWQPRLFRNIRSLADFGNTPHDTLWMAGESAQIPELYIYHWTLAQNDRASRERKAEFYLRIDPANACTENYLYEDFDFETAAFDDAPVSAIVRRLDGPAANGPYTVDLRIVEAPKRMRAGMRYSIVIEAANRTTRVLAAPSRYLSTSPFALTVHWWNADPDDERGQNFGVSQTPMPSRLDPLTARRYIINVDAPSHPGRYALQPDILEQDVAWFSQAAGGGANGAVDIDVL